METDTTVSEANGATPWLTESTMESTTVYLATRTAPPNPCAHSRAIDDALTGN